MFYKMPKIVNGIYKVFGPTSHTYVVCLSIAFCCPRTAWWDVGLRILGPLARF